jgi:hypothetical protein
MTKKFVNKKLLEIGFPAKYCGFKYISSAIMILDGRSDSDVKMTWMYYVIAKEYNTTPGAVERGIRYSLQAVRTNMINPDKIEHYIGLENPQNQTSLFRLYMVLKDEYESSQMISENSPQIREFIIKLAEQFGVKIAVLN